jgi:hypothetical protein
MLVEPIAQRMGGQYSPTVSRQGGADDT